MLLHLPDDNSLFKWHFLNKLFGNVRVVYFLVIQYLHLIPCYSWTKLHVFVIMIEVDEIAVCVATTYNEFGVMQGSPNCSLWATSAPLKGSFQPATPPMCCPLILSKQRRERKQGYIHHCLERKVGFPWFLQLGGRGVATQLESCWMRKGSISYELSRVCYVVLF